MRPTIEWVGDVDGHLMLLDQTLLPGEERVLQIDRLDSVIDCIVRLVVRGAPAIGVAASYGMVLGVRERAPRDVQEFARVVDEVGADEAWERASDAYQVGADITPTTAAGMMCKIRLYQRQFTEEEVMLPRILEEVWGFLRLITKQPA